MVLPILNSMVLILLSIVLVLLFLDFLRYKMAWRLALFLFWGVLLFQHFITGLEDVNLRRTLESWQLGALEEGLAFYLFLFYVLPWMIFCDLLIRKKIFYGRLGFFLLLYGISLGISWAQPGFWKAPAVSPLVILAYGSFLLGLAIFAWSLVEALVKTQKSGPPSRRYFPIILMVAFRFIFETPLSLLAPWIPFRLGAFLPLVFSIFMGFALLKIMLWPIILQTIKPEPAELAEGFAGAYGLTPRETEILDLLCRGLSTEQLAEKLFISEKTVNSHFTNIFRKCGVKSRSHLLARIRAEFFTSKN